MPLVRCVSVGEFDRLGQSAWRLGFTQVASGRLVQSTYHAAEMLAPVTAGATL
jgi:lipoate synthase